MSAKALSAQISALLEDSLDARPLADVLASVDALVADCQSAPEHAADRLAELEEELRVLHKDVFDSQRRAHCEAFLTILWHLKPVLTPSSIAKTWWDLVLKPALREPKLAQAVSDYAKDLVISAFENVSEGYLDELDRFRRNLVHIYVLNTIDDMSVEDALELETMDDGQKAKAACWKANLEDVLVRYGLVHPEDFCTELDHQFAVATSRMQLLTLMQSYTSASTFPACSRVIATHPLMNSLLLSLQLDTSTSAAVLGLTILTKLLPIFAANAPDELKALLPRLFAVLGRMLSWMEPSTEIEEPIIPEDQSEEDEDESEASTEQSSSVSADTGWQCLEAERIHPEPPSPEGLFEVLYYLFPCNTFLFFRNPLQYLADDDIGRLDEVWQDGLHKTIIQTRGESFLTGRMVHPQLLKTDAASERGETPFWAQYDTARIISEAVLLDARKSQLDEFSNEPALSNRVALRPALPDSEDEDAQQTPRMRTIELEGDTKPRIFLQDMVLTSLVLKSGRDIEFVDSTPGWPAALFNGPSSAMSDSESAVQLDPDDSVPAHASAALKTLQREALKLRSELNFELWRNRQNVTHIGKLYKDRLVFKDAEVEQQGLRNKLREFRTQVSRLQKELKEQREIASRAKQHNKEWHDNLQKRVDTFREKSRKWEADTAALRTENVDTKARLEAQGKLLADATNRVFLLETRIKENAAKVDRLHDYEQRINQLTKNQMLWDDDVQKLNEQNEEVKIIMSKYTKMQLQVESMEMALRDTEKEARSFRDRVVELEAGMASMKLQANAAPRQSVADLIAAAAQKKAALTASNEKLSKANEQLRAEVQRLKVELEAAQDDSSEVSSAVEE